MRGSIQRCVAQIIRDGVQLTSACSTSGRQWADYAQQVIRCIASGKPPMAKFDLYDRSKDVYAEFQDKWERANAEASAAAAELEGPPPRAPRPGFGPPPPPRPAPPVVPADADWPPGYGEMLLSYLQAELPLNAQEAAQMVDAARRGLLPASRELIRTRYMHLRDLEPRFPGFNTRAAVLAEPRLLRHSAAKLMRAMVVFQDLWSVHPVGPLMGRIGKFIITDPVGVAHRLHALSRAMRTELEMPLEPRRLTPGSVFLSASPYDIDARVAAVATIFGRQGGRRLLAADMDVLRYEPQELNTAVLSLRAVFAARGYGMPRSHHVGTAEGAAEAAADRAYVTELVVAWPGLLAMPGLAGEEGLAALVERIQKAGGPRYEGPGGRAAMLVDVAAQPEVLREAAAAVASGEEGRLEEVVEGLLRKGLAGERGALAGLV